MLLTKKLQRKKACVINQFLTNKLITESSEFVQFCKHLVQQHKQDYINLLTTKQGCVASCEYKIVKELNTETWMISSNSVFINVIDKHELHNYLIEYSKINFLFDVYETECKYVIFCISNTLQTIVETIPVNSKYSILTSILDNFVVLNRSCKQFLNHDHNTFQFFCRVGFGKASEELLTFVQLVRNLIYVFKYHPPHYLLSY